MAERYDIAILGTGPAGISAAITAKIRNKRIVLFGTDGLSEKLGKAHEILNYPGFPRISGSDLQKNLLSHLASLEIEITQTQVAACYPMGGYFSLLSKANDIYEAKSVIIATGVSFGKPYEGEEEFLGRGVSFCATCDAPLYKGKNVVVVAQSAKEEREASFLADVCARVAYVPLYKGGVGESLSSRANVEVVEDVPLRFEGAMKAQKIVLKGREIPADGFFILREGVSPKQLVPGIALDKNHISVTRKMETSVKGIFACGDITGTPYQYIKSAGEGNVAALSAVEYLAQLQKPAEP